MVRTPSRPSRAWLTWRWNISDETERPNGTRSQRYLPYGVEKVVRRLDSSSRTQCQKPERRSTVEKTLALASSGRASSRTGNWYVSRFRALLSGRGSTQTWMAPDFFVVMARPFTQCVVWVTGMITLISTSLLSSSLNLSFSADRILRGGAIVGFVSGSISRWTSPANVPSLLSNTSENLRTNSSSAASVCTTRSCRRGGVACTKFSLCTVVRPMCWAACAPLDGILFPVLRVSDNQPGCSQRLDLGSVPCQQCSVRGADNVVSSVLSRDNRELTQWHDGRPHDGTFTERAWGEHFARSWLTRKLRNVYTTAITTAT